MPDKADVIRQLIASVDDARLRDDLFAFSSDPLPYRKLNYTLPGHDRCTLYEADDFIRSRLSSLGYDVTDEAIPVQCYRRDETKPKAHQYSPPLPEDPWHTAYNLYAELPAATAPEPILVAVAHKDSQSWVDSPGALDNAVGTIALLEIARLLSKVEPAKTVRLLFCNEEHTPWTSITAAEGARDRGDDIIAVINLDGPAGTSEEARREARKVACTVYTCDEGRPLAELYDRLNAEHAIGLEHSIHQREYANDDDGSFVKAGFPAAVISIGSWPYADPNYHTEGDRPEHVDIANLRMAVQLNLAVILELVLA